MIVLGLTGSIGMGKSTVAQMFRSRNIPVFDADAAVQALYAVGGAAVGPVGAAFPGAVVDGAIDRGRLAAAVLGDAAALRQVEAIVHPLVAAARRDFLVAAAGAELAVLEIPLLFESAAPAGCDFVAVVSAPEAVQRQRVLARPGMTEAKFQALLARQLPDSEKRRHADFVIPTGGSLAETAAAVAGVIQRIRRRQSELPEGEGPR